MWRKIQMFHHVISEIAILILIIMCSSTCRGSSKLHSYGLSRCGFSPNEKSLLFSISYDSTGLSRVYSLGIYNEEKKTVKLLLPPLDSAPLDFAWCSEQDAFIVTSNGKMTIYRKETYNNNYNGTAVSCPIDFLYMYCSWNPKGELLAVCCRDLESSSGFRLGFYDIKENNFVVSKIVMDPRPPVWKDDYILYAPNNDKVVEVSLESGEPKLTRTIQIDNNTSWFYGIFDDHALVLKDKEVKLGNKTLVELDQARKFRIIVTKAFIFVSVSSKDFVVFNLDGREICRINPGSIIDIGSIGKNPNTIYGLTGSTLVQVCVENESLNIQKVCDLTNTELLEY